MANTDSAFKVEFPWRSAGPLVPSDRQTSNVIFSLIDQTTPSIGQMTIATQTKINDNYMNGRYKYFDRRDSDQAEIVTVN